MLGMPVAGINVIILAVVVAVALHAVSASPTNRMSLQQRVRRALGDVVAEKNRLVEAKSRQVILEDLQGASLQEATRLLSNTDPGFGRSDTYERQRYDPSGINPNIEVVIEFLHERKNVTVAPTTPSPASAAVGNDGSDDLWLKVDIGHHSGITRSSAWSKWSPCTVTCGQGFQVRIRSCGEDCTETAKRECRKKPCPRAALLEYEDEPDDYDDDPLESLHTRSLSTEPLAPLLLSLKHAMAGLDESSESESSKGNVCERWLRCPADDALRELTGVDALPDCPCTYSTASSRAGQSRWKDVSLLDGKLDIYNPGAARCIRSEPALSSSVDRHKWTGLSVQNCCYDEANTLLTRGSGAGSPHYVSPEISPSLHRFVDILPWLACKGDFTRFHASREPNNGNHCPVNPDEATFAEQVQAATTF